MGCGSGASRRCGFVYDQIEKDLDTFPFILERNLRCTLKAASFFFRGWLIFQLSLTKDPPWGVQSSLERLQWRC